MSEKMIEYVRRMKEKCKDYTLDCRFRLDLKGCEDTHEVKCPVVDHR